MGCSNRKKEISKLNSRKEITKEKCTVFLPFKDNIEYCGYRKHIHNTCGIFKMENLLKEHCITFNINDSKRNNNDRIQIDENIYVKKREQNDCNNESRFQEDNKYIKGDVVFEFSIVDVKITVENIDSSKDKLCLKLMILLIKLQMKIIVKM